MTLSHQSRAIRAARKHSSEAVEALVEVLRDARVSCAIKARAASLILASAGLIGSFGTVGVGQPIETPAHHANGEDQGSE